MKQSALVEEKAVAQVKPFEFLGDQVQAITFLNICMNYTIQNYTITSTSDFLWTNTEFLGGKDIQKKFKSLKF